MTLLGWQYLLTGGDALAVSIAVSCEGFLPVVNNGWIALSTFQYHLTMLSNNAKFTLNVV